MKESRRRSYLNTAGSLPSACRDGYERKSRKEEDLVGSVTAEVMDSCRVPVFAFPENAELISLDAIKRVAYFCNLDQRDIISVDTLIGRLFEYPAIEMTVIPVNDRAGN